ncbi:MAG: rRNA ((1402)-2-O)-methyltransferase [Actinomycetota bacterium]
MLILAATPIGNLDDASTRLRETLANASHIAAEDTRTLRRLAAGLGIKLTAQLHSFHEHSDAAKVDLLVRISSEADLILLTDAGMPTLSDPGFELVRACIQSDVEVSVLPGPNAALAAIAISGLPTDRFCVEGFVAKTSAARKRQFLVLQEEPRTMIFYDSPNRILATLRDAIEVFGSDRQASISRELTKRFEQTVRGSLAELAIWATNDVRGELVLVIAGIGNRKATMQLTDVQLVEELTALRTEGVSLRDAAGELSKSTGIARNRIYELGIKSKL